MIVFLTEEKSVNTLVYRASNYRIFVIFSQLLLQWLRKAIVWKYSDAMITVTLINQFKNHYTKKTLSKLKYKITLRQQLQNPGGAAFEKMQFPVYTPFYKKNSGRS